MSSIIDSSVTVSFGSPTGAGTNLRLEEDKDVHPPLSTRTVAPGKSVSAQSSTYVRLYPPATPTVVIAAATGSMAKVGDFTEVDVSSVVIFTPDSPASTLPVGVKNVRIERIGNTFDASGAPVVATVAYDAVRNEVAVSPACFCAIKVTHDADYTRYLYTFSGRCADAPPPVFDAFGNPINPLLTPAQKAFLDGLVYAIDPATAGHASLQLDPPECIWSASSFSFGDTDRERAVSRLILEIDSGEPSRIVEKGPSISAEVSVRCYPANAGVNHYSTSGLATRSVGPTFTRQVNEVCTFTNSAVTSLSYPPAGSISASVVGSLEAQGGLSFSTIRGPGETVTDVTYDDYGGGYTNPRQRVLGANEIAAVDLFNHPIPVHGLVKVSYVTTYDKYIFSYQEFDENGATVFAPAHLIVEDSTGRANSISLEPPTTKDKSRRGV